MANEFMDAVRQEMARRSVVQDVLARQCGLSQGHISKLLCGYPIGRRARERLDLWMQTPTDQAMPVSADELSRLGTLLKRHCDELAALRRQMTIGGGGGLDNIAGMP